MSETPQFASAPPICGPIRAAILCPGPSIERFPGRDAGRFSILIGVNRAVQRVYCDYWSMLDGDLTFGIAANPIGFPTILCDYNLWRKVQKLHPERSEKHAHVATQDITIPKRPIKWHTWSATAAIALAVHLGARDIECWGMDWTGVKDFDGYSHALSDRSESRWNREAQCYRALCDYLAEEHGAIVRRFCQDVGRFETSERKEVAST